MSQSDLDLADLDSVLADADPDETDSDEDENDETDDTDDSDESDSDESENEREILTEAPTGAMSAQQFAAHITALVFSAKIHNNEQVDASDVVQPASVYQTIRAQRDQIPHVWVQSEGQTEARALIYPIAGENGAEAWWMARRERLATRGTLGSRPASARTPEDNLTLLAAAQDRYLYACSRRNLWESNVRKATALIEKYRGFLNDQKVDTGQQELAIQTGTDKFNADQAEKASKKATKDKKGKKAKATA